MEKRATFLSCLLFFVLAAAFVPSIHATENGKSGEPILSEVNAHAQEREARASTAQKRPMLKYL